MAGTESQALGDGPSGRYHVCRDWMCTRLRFAWQSPRRRVGEVRQIGVFVDRWEILCKLAGRLGKSDRRLSFCDEAGLCGYGAPLPPGRGHSSIVVAPSLIPMKSGDRVKTISAMR